MRPTLLLDHNSETEIWSVYKCAQNFWQLSFQEVELDSPSFQCGVDLVVVVGGVQSPSHVQLFATALTAAHQASLSFTISCSLLKLMSTELVMLPNHLILCHPLLLLPSIIPIIKVFSSESVLHSRWLNYWSFSISPSKEHSGLIS